MRNYQLSDNELVYEAKIHFTGMVEYGTCMQDLTSGKAAIPLPGARFDQTFEGDLTGPKLRGKISGTDYLYIRPDGLFQLNLHAHICTQDDVNIAISSTGISLQSTSAPIAQVRSGVSLFTTNETYRWVNELQLWAIGSLDIAQGTGLIRAYAV